MRNRFDECIVSQPLHVEFDEFEFDEANWLLTKKGKRLRLSRRQLELLSLFLRNPDALILKREIKKVLWPDGIDGADDAIRVAFYRLQGLLRDGDSDTKYFEAEAGIGYRFTASVRAVEQQPDGVITAEDAAAAIFQLDDAPLLGRLKASIEKAVAPTLQSTMGFAHRDVREMFDIALEIATRLNLDRQGALRGLWLSSLIGGDFSAAMLMAEELTRIATTDLDAGQAAGMVGTTMFYRGQFSDSWETIYRQIMLTLWEEFPRAQCLDGMFLTRCRRRCNRWPL